MPAKRKVAIEPPPSFGESIVDQIAAMRSAFSLQVFANLTNISYKTAFEMASDGRLPVMRVGTSIRLDPAVIANWLRQRSSVYGEARRSHVRKQSTMAVPAPVEALGAIAEADVA